jgi:signal transduction protein with GAF and PtsI domain
MGTTQERRFLLKHFRVICHAIATYNDLNTLIQHLAEGTSRSFKAKGCSIMLLDEQDNQLYRVASFGISDDYLDKGPVVFIDDHNCAFYTGKPIFIENMQTDDKVQYPEAASKEGIVSMLSIPIKCHEMTTGVIRIYFDECYKLNDEDIETMSTMAELLGLSIDNNGLRNCLDQVRMALESLPSRML